jgi:predicted transcriptional regulator
MAEGEPQDGQDAPEAQAAKRTIASRGIPSKDSLYLPPHNSPELRSFQDGNESPTKNVWGMEEVVNFVFPQKYQEKYHEIALSFLRLLAEKGQLSGDEIGQYVSQNNVSKATFYNRVLPRLRRVGMIKVERQTVVALESKRKFRPMAISLSKTFGNYLGKIGDSWLAAVDDARTKVKK